MRSRRLLSKKKLIEKNQATTLYYNSTRLHTAPQHKKFSYQNK
jgi:hypothetical protein